MDAVAVQVGARLGGKGQAGGLAGSGQAVLMGVHLHPCAASLTATH